MTIYLKKPLQGLNLLKKGSVEYTITLQPPKNIKNIGILNLMPNKYETEAQFLKMFSSTNQPLVLRFLRVENHNSKNTPREYLEANYETLQDIKKEKLDGIIITGAPIEKLSFEDVHYWKELQEIFNFINNNIKTSFFICWGAQAALYHYYNIEKEVHDIKIFGVHKHVKCEKDKILDNIKEPFRCPNSRYTGILEKSLKDNKKVKTLLYSNESGALLLCDNGKFFILGHLEYEKETLKKEYFRDKLKGINIEVPKNYFPFDNAKNEPVHSWKEESKLLFGNWIKYYI